MEPEGSRKERGLRLHEKTEFARRLIAARVLREMHQDDLAERFGAIGNERDQRGVASYLIGRWEGAKAGVEPKLSDVQWQALEDVLSVSRAWFDVDADALLNPLELPGEAGAPESSRQRRGSAGTGSGSEIQEAAGPNGT